MTGQITVRVEAVKGSAPREEGAFMVIAPDAQSGSIGGGRLEWEATRIARQMLADGTTHARRTLPLGPDLGQCCGGVVTLGFTADAAHDAPSRPALWIWGAGHVGRALAHVVAPTQAFDVTVVDTSADRFPDDLPGLPFIAANPVDAVRHAPNDAHHIILTYSHAFDLALCDQLLIHGFASCGVIGSATKWARFRKRLAVTHATEHIARITCPIGDPSLGKAPQMIAIGVAADLLRITQARSGLRPQQATG